MTNHPEGLGPTPPSALEARQAIFVPTLPLLQAEGHQEEGAEQVESRTAERFKDVDFSNQKW